MKLNIVIIALLGLASSIYGQQNVTEFCNSAPPGLYCNSELTGYYWCLANPSTSSAFFMCPAGTQCLCFDGPNCENVPTVGVYAPCGWPPIEPTFPAAYTSTQDVSIVVRAPVCTFTTEANRTIYVSTSRAMVRVDTESSESNTCSADNSTVLANTLEYYTLSNDSSVTHYTFDVINQSCTASSGPGPLPYLGVPANYQFLRSDTFSNQTVDVYYFMNGLRIPQELYGVVDYIYVTKTNPAIPVFENRIDYAFRVNTVTNATTTSFTEGEPGLRIFELPMQCLNL